MALNEDIIKSGYFVIIRKTHDKGSSRLIKAETDKSIYLGKQKINLNGIFGHRFGSSFELDKSHDLRSVKALNIVNLPNISSEETIDRDNRFIKDDGKSQQLSKDQIETLKSEFSGKEVIENLVKNSLTFNEKTVFAQEKYLKKKQQKYSTLVTILRPNVRLLMEMYYSQGPQKINFLRIDSLSQMLSLCNVMSNGKYIVLDTHLGILTAAVVERLGSEGSVIQVYTEPGPVTTYRQAVNALNLPNDTINHILFGLQINEAFKLLHNEDISGSNDLISKSDETLEKVSEKSTDLAISEMNEEKHLRKEMRRLEANKAKQILSLKNIDGLLIISKNYDPLNILQLLLQFLSNSRPFVVFSPNVEPLTNCLVALKKSAVFLRLTETWLRKYQVLPDRTRPDMTMSSSSGYLLSGIKVSNDGVV